MKQRKLKKYVLPTLYVIILMVVFGAVSLVSSLISTNPNYLYAIGILKNGDATTVVETDGSLSEGIIKPYTSDKVSIAKSFYDIKATEIEQQNSLIEFQNTYMKNTGTLYRSDEAFDIVSVLDGTVINIKEDELLGTLVEVEHNTNLRTIYYSVEPEVKVGDVISQGEKIGVASSNKISKDKYNLLIEVYYNGTLINPETFYAMDITKLN